MGSLAGKKGRGEADLSSCKGVPYRPAYLRAAQLWWKLNTNCSVRRSSSFQIEGEICFMLFYFCMYMYCGRIKFRAPASKLCKYVRPQMTHRNETLDSWSTISAYVLQSPSWGIMHCRQGPDLCITCSSLVLTLREGARVGNGRTPKRGDKYSRERRPPYSISQVGAGSGNFQEDRNSVQYSQIGSNIIMMGHILSI
jgi:hypothetical protein